MIGERGPPPAGHPASTIADDGARGIALYRRNVLDRLLRPRYDHVEVPLVQVGITLGDAWLKYSMGGRAGAAGIQAGINVFLRGTLWDLGTDGDTISYRDGKASHVPDRHGAILVNQWL